MEIRGPGREVAFKGTLTPSTQFKDMCHQTPEKRRRIEVSQCQVTATDTESEETPGPQPTVEEAPQTQPTVEDLNEINDFI